MPSLDDLERKDACGLPSSEGSKVDLKAIRSQLEQSPKQEYWRSLEELAGTEEFQDFIKHEFPREADFWLEPTSRREFLKLMGAGFALGFFSACTTPPE